jgi:ABC-type transport system involved in multi-copper enzyme maturation permease subunit
MMSRIGPGPVFVYESLIFARRWQVYAGRGLFVLTLLVGLGIAWWNIVNEPVFGAPVGTRPGALQVLAQVGESFFSAMAGIQLAMVLLVAPAATAGAICHDRARGILAQMATTDLSRAEIVLGKLFSRLIPILGLIACALPVTAMAAWLGGIDIQALFSLFAVSAAVAVLGCTVALCVSVRAARTQDAIMAVLALWTVWLMSAPIWSGLAKFNGFTTPPDWFQKANPFVLVYAPYSWPGYVEPIEVAVFVAGVLAISAALTAATIIGLRHAVLPAATVRRGGFGPAIARNLPTLGRWLDVRVWVRAVARHFPTFCGALAWWPNPSLDGNPVLWREWHRNRPSRLTSILWGLYWLAAIASTGFGLVNAIQFGIDTPAGSFVLAMSLVMQSSLGMLLLSSQAPTSLGEERVRGSLDVLMSTPISTRAIVWGKWLGAFRTALWLAVLPGLATLIIACTVPSVPSRTLAGGVAIPSNVKPLGLADRIITPVAVVIEFLSYSAVIVSLGLFLAVWIRRPGRAIAISVAALVLFAIGWLMALQKLIWPSLEAWIDARYQFTRGELYWLSRGLATISPLIGPAITADGFSGPRTGQLWKLGLVALSWCVLAWAFAGALFWAALASFDRRLGRMRETTQDSEVGEPPRLAGDADECQNEDW